MPQLASDHSPAAFAASIRSASALLNSHGITAVGDAMVGASDLRALQAVRAEGGLGVRVTALMTAPFLHALSTAGIAGGFGDDWLRIGGIKTFLDGAVAGRSCAVAEPFEGSDDVGIMTMESAELAELVERADRAGLPLAVHANGERAITMLLDVLDAVGSTGRHRIEHCSIVTPELVDRIRRRRLIVVPFASYPLYHGDKLLDWYGAHRAERMFAHQWFLRAGVDVAGSSDYPCGPLDPRLGLQSMVTRRTRSGKEFGSAQSVDLREAIAMYTIGSAKAAGTSGWMGRLASGYLADATVFEGDLLASPSDELGTVPVLATWVGGEVKWQA